MRRPAFALRRSSTRKRGSRLNRNRCYLARRRVLTRYRTQCPAGLFLASQRENEGVKARRGVEFRFGLLLAFRCVRPALTERQERERNLKPSAQVSGQIFPINSADRCQSRALCDVTAAMSIGRRESIDAARSKRERDEDVVRRGG